jgi:signal transduction histidine kinase/ActR/RegA family two-component response regulator
MRRFAAVPIEEKLKMVVLITSVLTLLLAFTGLFFFEVRTHRQNLELHLKTLAQVIAANSTAAVESSDPDAAREMLTALAAESHVLGGSIYSSAGRRVAQFVCPGRSVQFPAELTSAGFQPMDKTITRSGPIRARNGGEVIGTIILVGDYSGYRERLEYSVVIVALVMLASLILAYFLSGRLRRFISAPIVALAETTRAVSEQRNYSLRAAKSSDDEIGRLIDDFNGMLARIEERDAALHVAQAELRRANEVLEEQKATVVASSKAKDQFLAMLSHELRTPLTPVLATVDSMENGVTEEELPGILSMIRRNVELEARLIDDLLDITRISKGKVSLELAPISVSGAIRSVVELVRHEITAKGIVLSLELGASQDVVMADSAKLQQVLWNLLRNAVKFTPDGGQVTLRTSNDSPETIHIEVSDTGIGMSADALGRVFDPFEQVEHATQPNFGGLGLGLSISKGLADAHGGTLVASSAGLGHGSAFSLTLQTTAMPRAIERAPVALKSASRKLRILLVEDHEDSRNALHRLLTRTGHTVATAQNFRSAIEAARFAAFDLLISDIGLPDGSGLELMRELQGFRRIQGIALSGLGMASDIQNSRNVGFSEHLTKPVSFEELKAAIDRIDVDRAA